MRGPFCCQPCKAAPPGARNQGQAHQIAATVGHLLISGAAGGAVLLLLFFPGLGLAVHLIFFALAARATLRFGEEAERSGCVV